MGSYEVVPEGEEPYEEAYLVDWPLLHGEVEEPSGSGLHRPEPAFNAVSLAECFMYPFKPKGF